MKIEKPITDNMKERCNKLYVYMKSGVTVAKDDVCIICRVKSERQARDIISTLAARRPIITTSAGKGYRLALNENDIVDVAHSWAELSSRIEELEKRIAPLKKFMQSYGK